jgi:hypothetical protein
VPKNELIMPSYILRNIDPTLWERVKARAAKEGHSLRWLFLSFLERYADGKIK